MRLARPGRFETGVCQALGIDPNVTRSVYLSMTAGELPVVTVEQWVLEEGADELVTLIRTFQITETTETP